MHGTSQSASRRWDQRAAVRPAIFKARACAGLWRARHPHLRLRRGGGVHGPHTGGRRPVGPRAGPGAAGRRNPAGRRQPGRRVGALHADASPPRPASSWSRMANAARQEGLPRAALLRTHLDAAGGSLHASHAAGRGAPCWCAERRAPGAGPHCGTRASRAPGELWLPAARAATRSRLRCRRAGSPWACARQAPLRGRRRTRLPPGRG